MLVRDYLLASPDFSAPIFPAGADPWGSGRRVKVAKRSHAMPRS
jgi:hypothetical protein